MSFMIQETQRNIVLRESGVSLSSRLLQARRTACIMSNQDVSFAHLVVSFPRMRGDFALRDCGEG
jgi:hypothetical protein